jgi:uncharacterized protein YqjF (DUF2071 family)
LALAMAGMRRYVSGAPRLKAPPVERPVMFQRWRDASFLHWPYPPEQVRAVLPTGLSVETFDGVAWVGLIPFRMQGVRPPAVPALPWLSRFPETNLRTYVRGPDGRTGIWFLSLEAARLPAVLAARLGYALPYCWAEMSVRTRGRTLVYRSRRRWPGPVGARCDAVVHPGAPIPVTEQTALDRFLTARYRLYSRILGRLVLAEVEHRPWPLRRARLDALEQDLIQAAGLPAPVDQPLVHASPGVATRIGMWRPVHNDREVSMHNLDEPRDAASLPDHDAMLQGGPLDGTSTSAGDSGLVELEVDGIVHRYIRTTQRGGSDGRLTTYAYDGAVDPSGAEDGAEHAGERMASPLAEEIREEAGG